MAKDQMTLKEIKSQDPFEEFLFHAADYVYRRRKTFTIITILILCLLIVIFSGFFWKRHSDRLQSEAFYEIEKMISNEESHNNKEILSSLQAFSQRYGESKQGVLAKFYAAQYYAKEKQFDKAVIELQEVVELFETTSPLRVLAIIYLSNAYRDMGKPQKSLELMESAELTQLGDTRLMELAEIHLALGDKNKSREVLQTLLSDYPSSGYKNKANELIKRLQ